MGHNDGKDLAMPIEGGSIDLHSFDHTTTRFDMTLLPSRVREYAHHGAELYPEDERRFPHHSICEHPLLSDFFAQHCDLTVLPTMLVEAS